MKKIIVIGAGASGLAASIEAGMAGADVTVIESGKRAGKKLLSTGNGRCNFTNLDIGADACRGVSKAQQDVAGSCCDVPKERKGDKDVCRGVGQGSLDDAHTYPGKIDYHSSDMSFVRALTDRISGKDIVRWFDDLGIPCVCRGTLAYPRSLQAASVLDALRFKADEAGVKFIFETKALSVERKGNSFTVFTDHGKYKADVVIVSAGGKALPSSGSCGSGAAICGGLGHRIIPETPALVPLKCSGLPFNTIAGVRTQAKVTAFCKERLLAEDQGEVQFTSYGLSGIPIMQVSGAVSRLLGEGGKCSIELDLMPEITEEALAGILEARAAAFCDRECAQLLLGILPRKLHEALLKNSGVPLQHTIGSYFLDGRGNLNKKHMAAVVDTLKHLRTSVEGTLGWEQAQVTSGGVDVSEVDPMTMESRLFPGLYMTGELLDVDGPCGGYNLHWAWATGIVAGRSAAEL